MVGDHARAARTLVSPPRAPTPPGRSPTLRRSSARPRRPASAATRSRRRVPAPRRAVAAPVRDRGGAAIGARNRPVRPIGAMEIQPITYRGRTVAACTPRRVFFSDELEASVPENPLKRSVSEMCLYAGEVLNGHAPAPTATRTPAPMLGSCSSPASWSNTPARPRRSTPIELLSSSECPSKSSSWSSRTPCSGNLGIALLTSALRDNGDYDKPPTAAADSADSPPPAALSAEAGGRRARPAPAGSAARARREARAATPERPPARAARGRGPRAQAARPTAPPSARNARRPWPRSPAGSRARRATRPSRARPQSRG
jgi:hypothetical protein